MLLVPIPCNVSMSSQPPPFFHTNLASCWDPSYMLQISQRGSSRRGENREEKTIEEQWPQILGNWYNIQYESACIKLNYTRFTNLLKCFFFTFSKSISIISTWCLNRYWIKKPWNINTVVLQTVELFTQFMTKFMNPLLL